MFKGTLDIDIETKSISDLARVGVYKYVEDPEFEILILSVSENDGEVVTYDLTRAPLPNELVYKIVSTDWQKIAHNAQFERICLSKYISKNYRDVFVGYGGEDDYTDKYLAPHSWYCTEVVARYHGLPGSLAKASENLELEVAKMDEGKGLINIFSKPQKKPLANGDFFYKPWMKAREWMTFVKYNAVDVEVELAIKKKLPIESVPDIVWQEYHTDQVINDRGVAVDMALVNNAYDMATKASAKDRSYLKAATRLENPASNMQFKGFLEKRGYYVETLSKEAVQNLLESTDSTIKPIIAAYQRVAKTSLKKYYVIQQAVCEDGRVRGCFKFYGAHTGRFSGRLVQFQNLPKNHLEGQELENARNLVLQGDFEGVSALGDVADILTQLIRTVIVPGTHSSKLIVADYSAIEARVLSWIVDEGWRLEAFRNGVDIYCASASKIYGVPVEKHGQNSHLRQHGKVAELALGYGGGYDAMLRFGGKTLEVMPKAEVLGIIRGWRTANSKISMFWKLLEKAVKSAINGYPARVYCIRFYMRGGNLVVELPSGRTLCYCGMHDEEYYDENYRVNKKRLVYREGNLNKVTWGGTLCENVTQAIARDILTNAFECMSGYKIVGHVHDEVIIEAPEDTDTEDVCRLMASVPLWCEGLPLVAEPLDTFPTITRYYHK